MGFRHLTLKKLAAGRQKGEWELREFCPKAKERRTPLCECYRIFKPQI